MSGSLPTRRLVLVAAAVFCWLPPAGCQPPPAPPPPVPRASRSAQSAAPKPPGATAASLPAPAPDELEPSRIRFRDATETSGITFRQRSGNSPEKHFPTANGSGIGLIDYDGDGLLDVYLATTRELPMSASSDYEGNRLYRNLGGGRFVDVTEATGAGFRGFTHGVAVGDVDNNGHPDLFLANLGPNTLLLNNGDGTFRDASANLGAEGPPWSSAGAFLDYDNDGYLDVYVTCYGQWSIDDHRFCGDEKKNIRTYCNPLLITPTRHYLYRNRGDGTFEDRTEAAGILRSDGRGMGVIATDLNGDGRIDLYVANDLSPHFLFLNKGDGTFEDATEFSGAAASESGAYQAGMGVDAEDVDGDGLIDLFCSHFRNDYNTLYRNLGGGNFQDVSAGSGIVKDSMPDVGWGCSLADFDNDGWPDMLVVNGHVDDNLKLLNLDEPQEERAKVWRNQGDGRFRLVADPGPYFATPYVARGAAFGDIDNDGDIDAIVSRFDSKPAVLLNESDRGNWVRLRLVATRSNRSAIGADIELTAGGRVLHRQVKGGGSYMSSNDPRVLIGLGPSTTVDRVEIRWPSGARSTLGAIEIGREHEVIEPAEGSVGLAVGRDPEVPVSP
jgi:hypothetical protein